MNRKAKRQSLQDPLPWSQWLPATLTGEQARQITALGGRIPDRVFINSRYEVWVTEDIEYEGVPGRMTWLSIKRRDKLPIRSWRDLQRIKQELLGADVEGVEIFPCAQRLVDTSNQYHLWCLPRGMMFPFGYMERLVSEDESAGNRQEPFDDDCLPPEVAREREEADHE